MSPAGSFGLSYNARRADRQWSFAPVAASYAISIQLVDMTGKAILSDQA
jgi:hypothetical protein